MQDVRNTEVKLTRAKQKADSDAANVANNSIPKCRNAKTVSSSHYV